MKLRYLTLLLACSAVFAATNLMAHEDERLNKALSEDGKVLKQYQLASLAGQLANIHSKLKEDAVAERMLQLAKETRQSIDHPYVRQAIAGDTANEVSSHDFGLAMRLLNQIEDTEIRVKTAWKLARKVGKEGDTDTAKKLLDECVKLSRAVEDLELRAELISGTGANYRYVDTARGAPLVYESYGLAQSLADPFDRGIMFNEVGAHLMDIGDKDLAVLVFDTVDQLVDEIEDPLKQAKVLVMLGGEQAEKGLRDRAAIALEKGVRISQRISDEEEKAAVVSEFARNLGQSHKFDRAIEVARSIEDPYHRAEGLIRIAKNMHRQGKEAESLRLLKEIHELTTQVKDPYFRGVALRKLASEYLDLKQPEQARPLLAEAIKSTAELAQRIQTADRK